MKKYALCAATIFSVALSPSAFAHASLQASSPTSAEVRSGSPREIVLRFNEALEAPFCKITLKDDKGTILKTDKAIVDGAHPDTLHLVVPKLTAGRYQVQWSTMTRDGHRTKGQYGFQVK